MRRTLFWTAIYATIAFVLIGVYNVWYDITTDLQIDPNKVPSIKTFEVITNNQQQVIVNQQITHTLTIAIFIFLIVRFYYEKHPVESTNSAVQLTAAIKNDAEIPRSYFDNAADKSIEDRKKDVQIT